MKSPPPGIQVDTYRNRDRDAIINSSLTYCKQNNIMKGRDEVSTSFNTAVMIFMDDLKMGDKIKTKVR